MQKNRGDIVYLNLPSPSGGGHEQAGPRPGIIVSTDGNSSANSMIMVVPLTTNLGASRFPFSVRVDPTSINGLSYPSVALVNQTRALDKARIVNVIGQLDSDKMNEISQHLRTMLGL